MEETQPSTQLSTRASAPLAAPLRQGAGLPRQELAPYLAPLRQGDPLGLGLRERPPPPPDPDAYDREAENRGYARSLLGESDRGRLDDDINRNGYLTVEQVRALLRENTAPGAAEHAGPDPELIMLVDTRTDYKVFIAGDNVYTRAELYDNYPFHEFNVQPEAVFAQQEIGVFPARKYALTDELEYVARDVGDETVDFMMLEDLVGQAAREGYTAKRPPLRVARTKVYLGKDHWQDFLLMARLARGAHRVAMAQIAYGGGVAGADSVPI